MTHQTNPAGAIELHGQTYLRDAKGNLVPLANVKPVDLLMDEMVRKMIGYAQDLGAELARFRSHCEADVAAFDALLDQQYNIQRPEATKGNRTFTSFDGCLQVKIAVSDRIAFGPELQSAKKLLDAMILEKAEGADPFLVALTTQAFKVDQEGKVDVQSILALRRLEVDDSRWPDITQAIDDSIRVIGSKTYMRFYTRSDPQAQWQMVPLDLAAAIVTPEAFSRASLRRQAAEAGADVATVLAEVEAACERAGLARPRATTATDAVRWLIDAQAEAMQGAVSQALESLDVAMTYLLDGAPVSAARCIADAAEALGGDLRVEAEEYRQMIADRLDRLGQQRGEGSSAAAGEEG